MDENSIICKSCCGVGVVITWIWYRRICLVCGGKGSVPNPLRDPLAGLSVEDRMKVLKRNPDPKDLERLGISIKRVFPPY